ncbi:hypothetical protein R6Q57_026413 [Mikania cordata]
MASAIARSTLRKAVRGGARVNPASTRSFSAGASAEEEAREAAKWEKITYVGIAACSILAFVNLSKGHPHFEEPPVSLLLQLVMYMVNTKLISCRELFGSHNNLLKCLLNVMEQRKRLRECGKWSHSHHMYHC